MPQMPISVLRSSAYEAAKHGDYTQANHFLKQIENRKKSKKSNSGGSTQMARRRNNYRRSNYRGGGGRRSYGGRRSQSMGMTKSPFYMGGAALGFMGLDHQIPFHYTLLAASLPLSGGGIGKLKSLAQGVVFGGIVKGLMGSKSGTSAKFGM